MATSFTFLNTFDGTTNIVGTTNLGNGTLTFSVSFPGALTAGSEVDLTINGTQTFAGTYQGTNANGDLQFLANLPINPGLTDYLLTNGVGGVNYTSGQVVGTTPQPFPCFVRGTLIATPQGERLVEDLRIGDLVVNVKGEAKPIVWVGSGEVKVVPWNPQSVIVRSGALAEDSPKRDLRLTLGHSLFIDGMLVQVERLINGRSIVWDTEATSVEYYHVEVEGHDVILAEGVPTETYRNDGNRKLFLIGAAGSSHLTGPNEAPLYAPIVSEGPEHERIWMRLADRADRALATREDNSSRLIAAE
jgi:hypothetical protein